MISAKKLLAGSSLAALIAFGVPALAQEAAPPTPAAEPETSAAEAASGDDDIVVTGSRIRRSEFTAPAPITVITSERSTLAGLVDTAEILQTSPLAAGQQQNNSFSAFLTDGGPGTNTISLRGLGAQKTLVLVNGRRFSPAGTSGTVNSVDLNTIPPSIIDRIEVLKDGASSIYGADAVAGVVNIITRTDLDGGIFGASATIPGATDGESYDLDLGWGRVFDRGQFNIALSYTNRHELTRADREWADCDYAIRYVPGTRTRTDIDPVSGRPFCQEIYSRPIGGAALVTYYNPGPTPLGPYGWVRFDPTRVGGNADPDLLGLEMFTDDELPESRFTPLSGVPGSPNILRGDQRSNEVAHIIPPSENWSLTSFGSYDLDVLGNAEIFYEAFVNRREQAVNAGWGQFFYAGANGPPGEYGMPFTNPLNPFGYTGPLGVYFGGASVVPLAPAYTLDPNVYVEVNTVNLTTGLRGDFFGGWNYEAYLQYGRSDGEQRFETFLYNEAQRALDAVDDGFGNIVCRSVLDLSDPDCVPLDAFSERFIVNGVMTPQERAYLVSTEGTETVYEQYSFTGFLTGELFQLPAGAVDAVFGVEYRNMRINDSPTENVASNNLLALTTAGQTKGRDSVSEVFTEIEVPIFRDAPIGRSLTANVSLRYTDYESYGANETYRLGLDWQVLDWFKVRSTFGTSFRPPALYEQFLADQIGFGDILDDPCLNYGTLDPGNPVAINCDALGLPPDWGSGGGPGHDIITGGGDDLVAETSEAFTFGFVWQPDFIDLNVAIDYYKIEVMDEIASLSDTGILASCYSEVGFTNALCARVGARDGLGFLTFVDASFVNIASQEREGIDVNFVYTHDLGWAELSFDGEVSYLIKASQEVLGTYAEFQGQWAFPEWGGQFDTRLDYRDFTFFWTVDWIGEANEQGINDFQTSRRQLETPNYFSHTTSVRYNGPTYQLYAGVRNLTDEEPPLVSTGADGPAANLIFNTVPGAGYDVLGRTFFIGANVEF